jgi:hypothetical protein
MMDGNDRAKRRRPEKPNAEDVLFQARMIWKRDPGKIRAIGSEDRDFREFFGCGVIAFLSLWGLLVTTDSIPTGGTIEHLLWTLMLMKIYGKQRQMCTLASSPPAAPETFRKWVWLFIPAIASLEPLVVSEFLDCLTH